ncbi:MAG TPA: hypothetical protein VE397_22505 [Stellaceae bacterium]|jgi:hypothetical protein|nr:hypothetical protein [Stellaceae bacterium]
MNSREAIEILMAIAAAYIGNLSDALSHGRNVTTATTDDQLEDWSGGDPFELEQYKELRDYLRASDTVQAILDQRGCDAFSPACDGSLTSLIDIILFG